MAEKSAKKRTKINKEAQMLVRVEKELRDRFVSACQEIDSSGSREIRRFMKQFVKRFDRGELDEQD